MTQIHFYFKYGIIAIPIFVCINAALRDDLYKPVLFFDDIYELIFAVGRRDSGSIVGAASIASSTFLQPSP